MDQLIGLLQGLEIGPAAVVDIALTALLIYGVFSLIRGTRAVRLVIGVTILYGIYVAAQFFGLLLLTQILQTGAVVGLLALVVIFQPDLRRALERIGRVGSLGWLFSPAASDVAERIAGEVARAAFLLAAERRGALIVLQRETGLDDEAEKGVLLHADLSAELLRTIFTPRAPLHDGAVIVHGERILAAGVVFELSETTYQGERFGTRHRAAMSITEQTDAVAIVVSEETGAVSLVERARRLRISDEERLRTALVGLLRPGGTTRAGLPGAALRGRRRVRGRTAAARPRDAMARSVAGESLPGDDGRGTSQPVPVRPATTPAATTGTAPTASAGVARPGATAPTGERG
ncbi:MAG TPA: diadenylate cyclase CdaA [Candidatus Limnocylindrales bacterium]|nr:diadenylate cyclase CdaA [Candidatus Limnocylindrales bacterium]